MAFGQALMIFVVASANHSHYWYSSLLAIFQYPAITLLNPLKGYIQVAELISFPHIHTGIVNHQLWLLFMNQAFECFSNYRKIGNIIEVLIKANIEVTAAFPEWKIFLAVNGTGKGAGFMRQHGGGTIALMHIQIKHKQPFDFSSSQ